MRKMTGMESAPTCCATGVQTIEDFMEKAIFRGLGWECVQRSPGQL